MSEAKCGCKCRSVQHTGNPVLDSLVNLISAMSDRTWKEKSIEEMHALLMKLAEAEPGGLRRHAGLVLSSPKSPKEGEL